MTLLSSLAAWLRRPAPLAAPAPPPSRFALCLAEVLRHEGGYVDHPQDPGGATNLGITLATLADWRGAEVTKADVCALTREEAAEIYQARYWRPLRCDDLPLGLDLMVFDFGVNAGPGRAARTLQRLLRIPEDGVIGAKTLAEAKRHPREALISAYADARVAYYRGLPGWPTFGKGWLARTGAVEKAALAAVA